MIVLNFYYQLFVKNKVEFFKIIFFIAVNFLFLVFINSISNSKNINTILFLTISKYLYKIAFANIRSLTKYEIKIFLNNQGNPESSLLSKVNYAGEFLETFIELIIQFKTLSFFVELDSFLCIDYVIFFINIIIFAIIEFFILKLRKKSWEKSEIANKYTVEIINKKDVITQNFEPISLEENKEEMEGWIKYYTVNNMLLLLYKSFVYIIFYINKYNLNRLFIIFNMIFKFHLLFSKYNDLHQILSVKKKHNKNNHTFSEKDITINNLQIFDLKINSLIISQQITVIKGKNGAGKTILCKCIANLLSFNGEIKTPKTIYLDNGSCEEIKEKNKLSQGQKSLFLIKKALNKEYKIIILDEMLDLMNFEEIKLIMFEIKKTDKKLIFITHNEKIASLADEVLNI